MEQDNPNKNRRVVVEGVAAGVLASALAPASAQQGTPAVAGPIGPRDYPKPPFPAQQQPWPGLASKMSPRPDHGETSYQGAARLQGRKALITGGDSGIGRAAAIAIARADVAIDHLPAEESDAREVVQLIRAEGRKAVAIPGDIRDEAFCRRLVADALLASNEASDSTGQAFGAVGGRGGPSSPPAGIAGRACVL